MFLMIMASSFSVLSLLILPGTEHSSGSGSTGAARPSSRSYSHQHSPVSPRTQDSLQQRPSVLHNAGGQSLPVPPDHTGPSVLRWMLLPYEKILQAFLVAETSFRNLSVQLQVLTAHSVQHPPTTEDGASPRRLPPRPGADCCEGALQGHRGSQEPQPGQQQLVQAPPGPAHRSLLLILLHFFFIYKQV